MGTEISNIDASWAEKLTKTILPFLSAPTVLYMCIFSPTSVTRLASLLSMARVASVAAVAGVKPITTESPSTETPACRYQDRCIIDVQYISVDISIFSRYRMKTGDGEMKTHLCCHGGHPVLQRAEAGPPEVSEYVLDVALLQVAGVDLGIVPGYTTLHYCTAL